MGSSSEDRQTKRSGSDRHNEFLQLSALATSGDLTDAERRELQAHLAECEDCRRAVREFEAAVDFGVPLVACQLAGTPATSSSTDREHGATTLAAAGRGFARESDDQASSGSVNRAFAFAHGNGHGSTRVNWHLVWLPFAACILLSLALATYTYRVGKNRHTETVSQISSAREEELELQIADTGHERDQLKTQLFKRDRTIAALRREIEQQSASLAEMKTIEANLEQTVQTDNTEKQRTMEEQGSLAEKLDAAEASVHKLEADLASAHDQRDQGAAQDRSLEAQILDLNRELREREETISKQDDLLSHDRDIRDLMGARDLYIAEVYDVGRDGITQKPCGRLFYTKGKSLIFYAYDLDEQPGVHDTSTFQAWGRRGRDTQDALSLGIFYEDNAAKRRWVLKSDDAKALEQIDAVFVTVEPSGGSHKPSGKPLLFAYLKIEPNHP